ncbi:hypothetical protein NX02_03975 [Sphingomonas sanxanigenens DSM 19645 = NX02]|uniref:Uncharacterized protein n=1 Tax=Sphingomonas sanxanigenens DSM 19645 = NX02 TaxID=1123269 RepID=W0A8B5_9SPHN|nr:hypothetical protein NX02_03975 [Sphingomonas sanxanigenens DSM 19645 = NX02]
MLTVSEGGADDAGGVAVCADRWDVIATAATNASQ